MTTPKNLVVPGTIVKVTNRKPKSPKAGCWPHPSIGSIKLIGEANGMLDGHREPPDGSLIEILEVPERIDGITTVKVKYSGEEFYSYYAHIRFDTTPL